MAQKKFQDKTKFSAWDLDNDGEITDEEIAHAKEIQETETKLRKNLAQLRMARSNLFYISGAGIVGTYMGTTAYMAKNGVK